VCKQDGCGIYSVDSSTVRTIAQPDEEFGGFATHEEFPELIPKGEIWLEEKNLEKGTRSRQKRR
jgi:hypothetical protein